MSWQDDSNKWFEEQQKKQGPYENPKEGCPKCARHRVVKGDDGKHRCEKCGWCIEDESIDGDFLDYEHGNFH